MSDRGTVRALVDRDGRLVEADPAFAALNARAGGAIGKPVAVVQVATLARLVRRLGVLVARSVTVADADHDLDLWVRAEPSADGVALAIADWRERQAWRPAAVSLSPDLDDEAADGRWETDGALRLTAISLETGRRFGFDAAAMLGKPLTHLFRLEEDAGGDLAILTALATRRAFTSQQATLRSGRQPVTLAARPRLDGHGGFAGYVGRIDAARGATAAGLSDAFSRRLDQALRAPLGRIVANADTIHAQAEGPLRQDYIDYAADIASAGRHLIGLIDDLADLDAIERPEFKVAAEPVDLADVARRAAGLLQVRAADTGVRIDRPGPDETLPVTGEFRRALQVLVNLTGNAVRYSPQGGQVWLRAQWDGDRALLIVADQGRGIAAENQARIFEKFERVDRAEPGGNGLGLYIARRLARAMGGDLTVESAPGQGARFIFSLPAA